jgi:hypothetical protein
MPLFHGGHYAAKACVNFLATALLPRTDDLSKWDDGSTVGGSNADKSGSMLYTEVLYGDAVIE